MCVCTRACVFCNRTNRVKTRGKITSLGTNLFTLKYIFFLRVSKSQGPHTYETAFAFIVQIRKMNSSQSMSSKRL